jgi:hypothetical protein
VDADGMGDVVDAAWLTVGVEAEQDVAASEIAEGAEGALHVGSHVRQA